MVPRISHILETCAYGTDLAGMERFYVNVLGLKKMSEGYPRHVFFRVNDQDVFLVFHPHETLQGRDVPAHGATGPGHFAFAVVQGELPAWRRHLCEQGIPLEREVTWPNGAESIYFRDPAGNSVELATADVWTEPTGRAGA